MQPVDWILVLVPLAVVVAFALYTNRYVRSVADFLSAGRCAGRYLLANAKGESEAGLSSNISLFELFLVSGFVVSFWDKITYPIAILVAISGFVVYRFRETRALTLAQFFEMRYSRHFRLFMGVLAFISGILNYGVFPAISARFFIYFLDLPLNFHGVSTFSLIMLVYLACTVFLVLVGGQATMMITCCLEGIFSQFAYVIIAVVVLYIVRWHRIIEVMSTAAAGESQLNPFDSYRVPDFNFWFIAMAICTRVYSTMAMQQKQGFNSAARTPHESRMGGVLGEWRGYARSLMLLVLAICAMTFLRSADFSAQSTGMHQAISSIQFDYLRQQATVPIALRYLLPAGIKGLFLSVMIMGLLSGDGGHLHSWGSIFIQDVILPLRKTPMSPKEHIWVLRCAIVCVAIFAFCFSTLFPQNQPIYLYWLLTAAIFVGGAGAAIIGGLYWRKGTTGAAWTAAITGSIIGLTGIACGHFWPQVLSVAPAGLRLPPTFWFNDQVSGFIAACIAAISYIIVSLATSRVDFNLDRMLHRGQYAIDTDGRKPPSLRQRFALAGILKFDENFSRGDRLIAGSIFAFTLLMALINIVTAIWNKGFKLWPLTWWANYWLLLAIAVPFVIAGLTMVWFSIAGVLEMREFFAALRAEKPDSTDDGRVATPVQPAFEVVIPENPQVEKLMEATRKR